MYFCLQLADDMMIKLWDWEKKWQCSQVFEGHTHYVMQIVINPKDNNQFASASLDRTIKVKLTLSRDKISLMRRLLTLKVDEVFIYLFVYLFIYFLFIYVSTCTSNNYSVSVYFVVQVRGWCNFYFFLCLLFHQK